MIKEIKYLSNRIGNKIIKDESQSLAAEIAFNFLLSIFPFSLFIISVIGFFGSDENIEQIISLISALVPSEVLYIIKLTLKEIVKSISGGTLTVGLIIVLWGASNVIRIIMKAINKAYGVNETRSFLRKSGLSMVIVLLLTFVMFIATNIVFLWSFAIKFLTKFIASDIINITLFVRWPISFGALFFILYIIYYFAPNIKTSKRLRMLSSLPGALFFCIFWLLASWIFNMYIDNIAPYNALYGTLGTFIVLLIWLYYTSLIILVGGEINSEIFKYLERKYLKINDQNI